MLHTHEATGSSPVVSTKNHRNRLIPVIFFRNLQLFEMLNFWRFFKTHTLTHTGKGAESTGQGQTGKILSGPVFFWNNRGISVIIIMCPAGLCLLGTDLFTPCIRKTINVTLPMSDGRGAFIFLQSGENTKSKLRSIFKSGKNPVCQKRNLSPLFLPLLLRGLWSISWRSIARY